MYLYRRVDKEGQEEEQNQPFKVSLHLLRFESQQGRAVHASSATIQGNAVQMELHA